MLRELVVFASIYGFAICAECIHRWWKKRQAAHRAQEDDGLEPFDYVRGLDGNALRIAIAVGAVVVTSPAGVETVKHYAIHLIVYSGYIIPH